jgi:hypothetical protein
MHSRDEKFSNTTQQFEGEAHIMMEEICKKIDEIKQQLADIRQQQHILNRRLRFLKPTKALSYENRKGVLEKVHWINTELPDDCATQIFDGNRKGYIAADCDIVLTTGQYEAEFILLYGLYPSEYDTGRFRHVRGLPACLNKRCTAVLDGLEKPDCQRDSMAEEYISGCDRIVGLVDSKAEEAVVRYHIASLSGLGQFVPSLRSETPSPRRLRHLSGDSIIQRILYFARNY